MKKMLLIAAALVGFSATAETTGPAWTCQLSGNISGVSIGLIGNITSISGDGVLSCQATNDAKVAQQVPVKIDVVGVGVGLGFTRFENIQVVSAAVGVSSPEALVSTYSVGPVAGATLIDKNVELGAKITVSTEGGLAFEVGFAGGDSEGLQAKLELQGFRVSPR